MFGDDHDKSCGNSNCECRKEKGGMTREEAAEVSEADQKRLDIQMLRKAVPQYTGHSDIDEFLYECFETMRSKGHDYRQGNADLLHNFRTVAGQVGIDPKQVWLTYFYKHYAAMVTYIKENGQSESEPIESRIKDQIVYLLLLYRMIQEEKTKNVSVLGEIVKKADAADRQYERLRKLKDENIKRVFKDFDKDLAEASKEIGEGMKEIVESGRSIAKEMKKAVDEAFKDGKKW